MRVGVVIPAHNEERNVEHAVMDIVGQTYPVETIVVVNDCSTDRTGEVLTRLQERVPTLVVLENGLPRLRAGAINCGLDYLKDKRIDLVMAADADSRFDEGLLEAAVDVLSRHARAGGVCSTSGVVRPERVGGSRWRRLAAWYLWRIQRLDGAGFDAARTATWRNVQILHGLCSVFRLPVLLSLGGYSAGHLLEDYDLTVRLKKAGWNAMFCPGMRAWTKVPLTFRSFFRQRLRWMRGGIDILLQHGVSRHTCVDFVSHVLFAMLFCAVACLGTLTVVGRGWRPRLSWHPVPVSLAGISYLWSLYKLRFVDRLELADALVRIAILPELALAMALSLFQLSAYYLSILRRPKRW